MKTRLPLGLTLAAVLQFIPPLVLPPALIASIPLAAWVIIALLFVGLGLNLMRRKNWARLATIFVQGFNIIVRLLVIMGQAVTTKTPGGPLNVAIIGTFLVSMLLSAVILYYIDQPDVQVVMQ